jgi:hypothetical protein
LNILLSVFGMKLEAQDSFVLGYQRFNGALGALPECGEVFRGRSHVIVVIFIQSEISELTLEEIIHVFSVGKIFKGKVYVLKSLVESLSYHLDVFGASNELMPEANAENFQGFIEL